MLFYNKSLLYNKTGCLDLYFKYLLMNSTQNLPLVGMKSPHAFAIFFFSFELWKKIGNGNLLQFKPLTNKGEFWHYCKYVNGTADQMSLKGPRLNTDWPGGGSLCILTPTDPPSVTLLHKITESFNRDIGGEKQKGAVQRYIYKI